MKNITRRKFLGLSALAVPAALGADARFIESTSLRVTEFQLNNAGNCRFVHFSDFHHKGDVRYATESVDAGDLPCRPCDQRVCEPVGPRVELPVGQFRAVAAHRGGVRGPGSLLLDQANLVLRVGADRRGERFHFALKDVDIG